MAGSVNKVILIGNLGKDPEVRKLENGATVANFPIATSESYTDRNSGERKEITDWHDIVVWRGLAEVVEKYVRKGTKIYVEGRLKKRSWQDKEGQTRYTTEVLADNLTILSSRNDMGERSSAPDYSNQGTPPTPNKIDELLNDDNDDLPF
ncbi:MAG: single-stranded DNA-binding protein [Crocinitomicaceae bacterium]|jgi:single-strand DNA-binding protein|nr:single-stranded DNA-binding protein [Crocinitomicaceae bacterium]